MSYLVLARKWRPQTFEEVVGQEHVTRTLRNAIQSGRIAHAFLFTGPRGVGKTTIARLLAKALNCEHGPTPNPCNSCSNCTEITTGSSMDVLEIDGASHTGVDNVRDITEGVQYQPAKSRFRVVIIDEVHMLSNAAFNALLKTLEEPPAHVKFIFATTEAHKILQTILSRCQRYDFKRIPLRDLIRQLTSLGESEGFAFDEVGISLIAREADGSLRDAESLLEQVVTWSNGDVNEETVRAALGVADRHALFRVVDAVLDNDSAQVLRIVGDLYQYGYDPRRLCRDLLEHFHQLVIAKVSPDPALLAELPDHEITLVKEQAGKRSLEDLQRFFTLMLRAEEDISHTAHTQLVIEMTLVKLASQPPIMPIEEALARLEALQQQFGAGAPANARPAAPPQTGRRVPPALAARPSQSTQSTPEQPPDIPPPPIDEEGPVVETKPTLQSVPLKSQNDPSDEREGNSAPWERFLAAVQKTRLSLFFALKSGQMLELTQTQLLIGVNKEPYFKELTRKENKTLLEETAGRILGRPVTVEVIKGVTKRSSSSGTSSGSSGSSGGSAPGTMNGSQMETQAKPLRSAQAEQHAEETKQYEEDPLVKTVLDVLGGEVQAVRSRGSAEPPHS